MDNQILDIMRRVFQSENIDENTSQLNCENWDSIHHLNFIVELENEFGLEFEPEEIADMNSFGKVKEFVSLHLLK